MQEKSYFFISLLFYYFTGMAGRKPIYRPETLEIGQKMALPKKIVRFGYQYVHTFNQRNPGKKFKFDGESIQRII